MSTENRTKIDRQQNQNICQADEIVKTMSEAGKKLLFGKVLCSFSSVFEFLISAFAQSAVFAPDDTPDDKNRRQAIVGTAFMQALQGDVTVEHNKAISTLVSEKNLLKKLVMQPEQASRFFESVGTLALAKYPSLFNESEAIMIENFQVLIRDNAARKAEQDRTDDEECDKEMLAPAAAAASPLAGAAKAEKEETGVNAPAV
jgi:hypothetical protein